MGMAVIATPSRIIVMMSVRIILSNIVDLPFLLISFWTVYTRSVSQTCQNGVSKQRIGSSCCFQVKKAVGAGNVFDSAIEIPESYVINQTNVTET